MIRLSSILIFLTHIIFASTICSAASSSVTNSTKCVISFTDQTNDLVVECDRHLHLIIKGSTLWISSKAPSTNNFQYNPPSEALYSLSLENISGFKYFSRNGNIDSIENTTDIDSVQTNNGVHLTFSGTDLKIDFAGENHMLNFFDISGKIVSQYHFDNTLYISKSDLPKGILILQIDGGNQCYKLSNL